MNSKVFYNSIRQEKNEEWIEEEISLPIQTEETGKEKIIYKYVEKVAPPPPPPPNKWIIE
jgi:hypothetical protein